MNSFKRDDTLPPYEHPKGLLFLIVAKAALLLLIFIFFKTKLVAISIFLLTTIVVYAAFLTADRTTINQTDLFKKPNNTKTKKPTEGVFHKKIKIFNEKKKQEKEAKNKNQDDSGFLNDFSFSFKNLERFPYLSKVIDDIPFEPGREHKKSLATVKKELNKKLEEAILTIEDIKVVQKKKKIIKEIKETEKTRKNFITDNERLFENKNFDSKRTEKAKKNLVTNFNIIDDFNLGREEEKEVDLIYYNYLNSVDKYIKEGKEGVKKIGKPSIKRLKIKKSVKKLKERKYSKEKLYESLPVKRKSLFKDDSGLVPIEEEKYPNSTKEEKEEEELLNSFSSISLKSKKSSEKSEEINLKKNQRDLIDETVRNKIDNKIDDFFVKLCFKVDDHFVQTCENLLEEFIRVEEDESLLSYLINRFTFELYVHIRTKFNTQKISIVS